MALTRCVGMVGTPDDPKYEWSRAHLTELKEMGFHQLQVNIAWGDRPNDEPLNLEDVVMVPGLDDAARQRVEGLRARIRERVDLCREVGLRSLFHFGAPFNGRDPYGGAQPKSCIMDPSVVDRYRYLLAELNRQIPGIDDILVYTYDQDAWLCSEFESCPHCHGVPLHRRLPSFLTALCDTWASINHDGIVWWEPWELSAGQALRIIEALPCHHFGLCVHSNIGEVQLARPADLWLRNTAMLAARRGIPVICELFLSEYSEEVQPLRRIPCPVLTWEEIHTVSQIDGVVGVKEYYGLLPGHGDPCLAMAGEAIRRPEASLAECLTAVAAPYGENAQAMIRFWERVSAAYRLYPWDVSWFAREVGKASVDHGWSAAFLRGQQCSTPSWDSTRHGIFMKTDDRQPHPWMLEDIGLRCGLAARETALAIQEGEAILPRLTGDMSQQMRETIRDLDAFRRVCVSYEVHLRETNVAMMLREELFRGRPLNQELVCEMGALLERDEENQNHRGRVVRLRKEWQDDPEAWLQMYLLPCEEIRREKGYFSLTTR